MKIIATALIALSVLTGAVAPVLAAGGNSLLERLDREGRGGHMN